MLFAIFDYIQYINQHGRYSVSNVTKEAKLCTKENLEESMNRHDNSKHFSTYFFYHRTSFLSWTVMYYTQSIWSHCASYLNDILYDMTTSGCIKSTPLSYIDNKSYFSMTPIEVPKLDKMIQHAEEAVGTPYGWYTTIKMFFRITSGKDEHWKLKFSLDIYILVGLLYYIDLLSNTFTLIFVSFYTTILFWYRVIHKTKETKHNGT